MKTKTYMREFPTRQQALDWCRIKNKTAKANHFAVVEGPRWYSVVDLALAIELEVGYEF